MKTSTQKLVRLLALMLALVTLATCALTACTDPDKTPEGSSTPSNDQNKPDDGNDDGNDDNNTPEYNVITIAEALELCGEEGNITTERYYIRGTIVTIKNAQYGQMVIEDETGSIEVYGTYSEDGSLTYPELEYSPVKGDEVLLHCILQNYGGTKEVKNARLIEYKNNQGNIDVSEYTSATIKEARDAEKGTNLKVKGVVARITYANGMKPNGFILIGDGASIYVYDMDAAQRVKIGNTVEIAGTKDYWILDTEQASAEKFGYKGCNQLTDAILISNDNGSTAFDTSWITETTVKDLIEAPVTEDITTVVYKVNALVKKVPGSGFTNYYFFDLDGETGSYTYTQCNGGDFAWLDEFDGKICTVYLTALNAKSSGTSCYFRLLPVAVIDEGFKFDLNNTAEHVVKYYGVGQFKSTYAANPELELVTSVSSALLGFENATLTYTSDNEVAVKISEKNGKLIMECLAQGKANITVSVTFNGKTYSETVSIEVEAMSTLQGDSVKTAIDAKVGDEVLVEGIVGPSLVNKNGFYLIDATGVISIVVDNADSLKDLSIGQKVVIKGKRDNYKGQTCVTAATVEANYFGKHDYDTTTFITDKTFAEIASLPTSVDYTTTVFVCKATVVKIEAQHYSQIKLSADGKEINLYCSSASQYGFLNQFVGQEITVELALCNWNEKSPYKACVLSATGADGTKVLNTLNFAH